MRRSKVIVRTDGDSMMSICVLVCCLLACFALTEGAVKKLPSYIQQCSRSDPKLNDCALKSARDALSMLVKGDPKFRILPIDPAAVQRIAFGDNSEKPVGMGFVMENCTITGLGSIDFTSTRFDLKKLHVEVEGIIPKLVINGKYKVKGKILVLPIRGDGDANFTITGVKFIDRVNYELYKKKDNQDYFRVHDAKIDSTIQNVHVDLTNLFNGDKALGNNMNLLLNENWQELEKISRPVIEQAIADLISNLLNNLLRDIPYDLIFLP